MLRDGPLDTSQLALETGWRVSVYLASSFCLASLSLSLLICGLEKPLCPAVPVRPALGAQLAV